MAFAELEAPQRWHDRARQEEGTEVRPDTWVTYWYGIMDSDIEFRIISIAGEESRLGLHPGLYISTNIQVEQWLAGKPTKTEIELLWLAIAEVLQTDLYDGPAIMADIPISLPVQNELHNADIEGPVQGDFKGHFALQLVKEKSLEGCILYEMRQMSLIDLVNSFGTQYPESQLPSSLN